MWAQVAGAWYPPGHPQRHSYSIKMIQIKIAGTFGRTYTYASYIVLSCDSAWPTWKKNHESMNHDLDNLGWHHQACVTMCNWRVTVVVRLVTMALPWFETRLPTTMSRGLDLGAAWIGKTAPMIQWLVPYQSSHNHGSLWTCKVTLV